MPISGIFRTALAVLLLLSAGCSWQSAPQTKPVYPGASVVINQAYNDLPNATRLYFQFGKQVERGNLARWDVHCELFVYNPAQGAEYRANVAPGRFKIIGVDTRRKVVDSGKIENLKPVALQRWDENGPPSYILYKTGIELSSTSQPDVRELNCYRKASTYGDYLPRLFEIRNALGDLIEIDLNSIATQTGLNTTHSL